MNLDIVNLNPKDWSKETWRYAYAQYCQGNMFGPKTKREYYDFVIGNHVRLEEEEKPVSAELLAEHTKGWRAAVAYAKAHKCDRNGCPLESTDTTLADRVDRAEEIAVDTAQRLDYLISKMKGKGCGRRDNDNS